MANINTEPKTKKEPLHKDILFWVCVFFGGWVLKTSPISDTDNPALSGSFLYHILPSYIGGILAYVLPSYAVWLLTRKNRTAAYITFIILSGLSILGNSVT